MVAIDGTFLKAVNSPRRNYSQGKVRRMIEEIDRRTDAYLEALEVAEREAPAQSLPGPERPVRIQSKLAELEDKRRECEALLEKLSREPGAQISETDPESRALRKNTECLVGYNAQIAVDSAQHLIAAQEVTQEPNDATLLAPMAQAAREALGVEKIAAVADRGYYSHQQVRACRPRSLRAFATPQCRR